jgi:hypothetical protein
MASPKSQEKLRKQKEAKQKKIVLLLVPVLLIAGGFNVVRMLGGGEETTAASSTSATDTSAAAADTSAAAGTTAPAAGTTTPPAAGTTTGQEGAAVAPGVPGTATLIDSDVPAAADDGQLVSFERFVARNPFVQQVEDGQGAAAEPEQPSDAGGEAVPSDGGTTDDGSSGDAKPNAAELTVNGAAETVAVGGSFPASDPTFKLVAVKGETVKIGLVTGSFSTGVQTIDLKVGQTLTLVSQPDGIRYVIKLVAVTQSSGTEDDSTGDTVDTGIPGTTPTDGTVPDTGSVPSTTGADSGTSGVPGTTGVAGYAGG